MTRKRLNKDDLSLWKKVAERTEKLDVDKLFRAEIDGAAALKGPAPTPPQIRKTTFTFSCSRSRIKKGSLLPQSIYNKNSPTPLKRIRIKSRDHSMTCPLSLPTS